MKTLGRIPITPTRSRIGVLLTFVAAVLVAFGYLLGLGSSSSWAGLSTSSTGRWRDRPEAPTPMGPSSTRLSIVLRRGDLYRTGGLLRRHPGPYQRWLSWGPSPPSQALSWSATFALGSEPRLRL